MIKTYKKGQTVQIISTYISVNTHEYVLAEVMFCNNQSLLVKFNKELYEVPEKAIISIVDIPVNQDSSPKTNIQKKSKVKTQKQVSYKEKTTTKSPIQRPAKIKQPKRGRIIANLIYIPAKEDSYSYYRRSEPTFSIAHERAYWAMTHPFVGGGCSPR